MARHYIGVTRRGITTLDNVRKDPTGEPLILMDEGEVKTLVVDFAEYLESGETVSSATADDESVTASIVTSSPTVTLTLSAATSYYDGKVTLLVTMSSGNKFRTVIRVRRTDRYTDEALESDYA